jgi:hypothetical protein
VKPEGGAASGGRWSGCRVGARESSGSPNVEALPPEFLFREMAGLPRFGIDRSTRGVDPILSCPIAIGKLGFTWADTEG